MKSGEPEVHMGAELLAYLDDALTPHERAKVEAHLAACPHCAAELERLRALRLELGATFDAALSPVHLPREAEERIRAALRARVQRPRWLWELQVRWGLFAQAALALLMVLFSLNAYQAFRLPLAVPQEVLVLGQERLVPGSKAALRVVVHDAGQATPVPDAEVAVSIGKTPGLARLVYQGRTDATGTAEVAFTVPAELRGEASLVVEARTEGGQEQVVHPITIARSTRLFLTSDKPAYRPGQTLHLRVLALDALELHPAAGETVEFMALDASGQPFARQSVSTSDFGIAAVDFDLPETLAEGAYTVRAVLGDTISERAVTVGAYTLPSFRVAITPEHAFYTTGDQVTGTVEAAYFFGKPVAEAEVVVYGSFEPDRMAVGQVSGRTDAEGRFTFAFDLPAGHGEVTPATFAVEAAVVDGAGQSVSLRQSVPVAGQPILIRAIPESGVLKPGVENTLFVLTAYPDGTPAVTEVTLSINGERRTLQTDSYGLAAFRFVPDGTMAEVAVVARDAEGAEGEQTVRLDVLAAAQALLLRAERALYQVGETLRLEVLSAGLADGQPVYLDVVRGRQMVAALSTPLEGGRATFALDLDAPLMGALQLHAYTLSAEGSPVEDLRWVVVDAPQGMTVTVEADRDVYRPGETARLAFRTHLTPTGEPVAAALGIGVVDPSVYALETLPVGFARLYFLLDQDLFARRDQVPGTWLEDEAGEARDLAAQAAWAGMSGGDFTLSARGATPPPVDAARTALAEELAAVLALLPLFLAGAVVRGLLAHGLLSRALNRVGLGTLGVVLAAPLSGGLLWVALRLWWQWVGAVGVLPIVFPVVVLLAVLLWCGWHYRSAHVQVISVGLVVYLVLGGCLVWLMTPGALLTDGTVVLLVTTFLLLVLALALVGQGMVLEGHFGTGWSATLLGILLIPLVIYLSFVPALRSDLTRALGSPGLYAGPVGWLTGCAAQATPASTEAPTEAPAEEVTEEPTEEPHVEVQPTQAPQPTATPPIVLPAPYPLRQIFPETLYWNPEALTDAEGRLALDLPLADSITTWRLTVLGSTREGVLGAATADVNVFQEFFVDVTLPEAIVVGEPVTGTVTLYNYADAPQTVRFQMAPQAGLTLVTPPEALTVAAHDVASVPFVIRAEQPGETALQLTAVGRGGEDAVLEKITVVEER